MRKLFLSLLFLMGSTLILLAEEMVPQPVDLSVSSIVSNGPDCGRTILAGQYGVIILGCEKEVEITYSIDDEDFVAVKLRRSQPKLHSDGFVYYLEEGGLRWWAIKQRNSGKDPRWHEVHWRNVQKDGKMSDWKFLHYAYLSGPKRK